MTDRKYPVKRGKEYELYIEKLAFGGGGVARVENYVIFVKGALPGDRVRAKIQKRKSAFAEARLLEVLEPSPQRRKAPCPYFDWCGGCTWQNLSYENQLQHKQKIVEESMQHIAGLNKTVTEKVVPSDQQFEYRNKMEFSFSDRRWLLPHELGVEDISRDYALGLHIPGTFDKILQIDHCLLQSETANKVLNFVNHYVRSKHLQPYGIRSHEGFLRFLVIRQSAWSKQIMVNIVTAFEDREALQPLADQLLDTFDQVGSVINNINARPAQIAVGEKEILLAGKPVIQEKLGPFEFDISANSFFQTNTKQAEKLYDKVMEFAALTGNERVWDLYSGTGTISLYLAREAAEVTGFELVESAVADARRNAANHQVQNTRFLAGDLLQQMQKAGPAPQVLVTDPPRAGMHEKVVHQILECMPRRIVYVSCNPTTLARDLALLSTAYEINHIQPVDMFPQTYHIETVVQLTAKQADV